MDNPKFANKVSVRELAGQICSILAIVLVFVMLWSTVWYYVTSRCISDETEEMKVKMIDVSRNLPFDENSHIAHCNTDVKLSGDLPVLDGAAALFPLYSAYAEAVYPEESVRYDRETEEFAPDSALQYRNTVRGFNALLDGSADVFFSAYPSNEQRERAEAAGVEITYVPIGKEAFVFLVNSNNPVSDLTSEQLRGLFTGKYRNWKEVGGANRPVHTIKRVAGSGSQSRLEAFLNGEKVYTNPMGLMGAAIGYSFRWYVTDVIKEGEVKILAVDGVYPDETTIADSSYPLTTPFYAMYRSDNPNPNVPVLLDFILSEEGQQLTEDSGYVRVKR